MGYFYDYTNHLNVFSNGSASDIESSKVTNIQAGVNYISYVDSKNSFVVYDGREKHTLEEFAPTKISATPYTLVYKSRNRLMIFEEGTKKMLSKFAGEYYASDSMIIWQSLSDLNLMAYYRGKSKVVEFSVSTNVINDGKIGSNIFAFNTVANDFMIYYNNKVFETGGSRISDYQCGQDIVAFTDIYKNTLNVFYKGEIRTISNKIPKSFIVSNETVSFVDADDNFNIYYRGGLTKIDSYAPQFYNAKDNVIYYSYNSALKAIYEGKIFTDQLIEEANIIPGRNSLLYFTQSNTPVYFYKGKKNKTFYIPKPYTMELNGDLPVFYYGNNIAFLYDGRIFEYGNNN
jgi:hypothetical protein